MSMRHRNMYTGIPLIPGIAFRKTDRAFSMHNPQVIFFGDTQPENAWKPGYNYYQSGYISVHDNPELCI